MAAPLLVRLDQAACDELDRRYQTTRDATTRTRYQLVLPRADGHPVVEVARITRRGPDTLRRVLKLYLAGGPDAVPHRPPLASRPTTRPAGRPSLPASPTATPPRSGSTGRCGPAGGWPTTWRSHRAPRGIETVRIASHRAGDGCKRPRWTRSGKAQSPPGWANA